MIDIPLAEDPSSSRVSGHPKLHLFFKFTHFEGTSAVKVLCITTVQQISRRAHFDIALNVTFVNRNHPTLKLRQKSGYEKSTSKPIKNIITGNINGKLSFIF